MKYIILKGYNDDTEIVTDSNSDDIIHLYRKMKEGEGKL